MRPTAACTPSTGCSSWASLATCTPKPGEAKPRSRVVGGEPQAPAAGAALGRGRSHGGREVGAGSGGAPVTYSRRTAKATHGTGLQGMADRLAAVGGSLRID